MRLPSESSLQYKLFKFRQDPTIERATPSTRSGGCSTLADRTELGPDRESPEVPQNRRSMRHSPREHPALSRRSLPFLLLLSGFCGISYEILYTKLLGNLLGNQFTINATVLLTFLLGIGIRSLSVDPAYLLRTQQTVASMSIEEAEPFAKDLLSQNRICDVAAMLEAQPIVD